MEQAKNWYRWATQPNKITRASGAPGPAFRTMGRRGLVGNAGQATAQEIAQAVYEEDLAREERAREQAYYNARANGWSPTMMARAAPPPQKSPHPYTAARNLPMRFVQAGIYGGKSCRQTRRSHKRTRTHRRR